MKNPFLVKIKDYPILRGVLLPGAPDLTSYNLNRAVLDFPQKPPNYE